MSNTGCMKNIILNILQDGKSHSIEEIKARAIEQGVELGEKNQTMRNALYALKKMGYRIERDKLGEYTLYEGDMHISFDKEKINFDGDLNSFQQYNQVVDEIIDIQTQIKELTVKLHILENQRKELEDKHVITAFHNSGKSLQELIDFLEMKQDVNINLHK